MILCQSIVRQHLSSQHVKRVRHTKCINDAATLLQSNYRMHSAIEQYIHVISCIILVQAMVRRWLSARFVGQKRVVRRMDAATKLQGTWRSFIASNQYMQTLMSVVLVQTLGRRRLALTHFKRLKDEKCRVENNAATIIQSRSRGLVCARKYRQTVLDLVRIQSLARKLIAVAQLEQMRYDRSVNACINVQAAWRAFSARNQYIFTIASVVLVQCLGRRRLALANFNRLKDEKYLAENKAATMIQSEFRAHFSRMEYMLIVWDNIIDQSLTRCAVESCSVTKISSSWRRTLRSMEYRQTIEGRLNGIV